MCFFLEKDIVADTLEAGWAKQEKAELKGGNTGRKSIIFLHEGFYFEEKQEKQKVCHRPMWLNFVCLLQRGTKLKAQQTRSASFLFFHCGLMEKTPVWGAVPQLHFWTYTLFLSTSYLHPWAQDVFETEVTTSHCQTHANVTSFCHAGIAKRHSCWHFLKPHLTGIHHSQLSTFLPHVCLQPS